MTFYRFAKGLVSFFIRFRYKLVVTYKEEIPEDKGFILACNHQSNLDPVLLAIAFHRQVNYMAKEELFHNKILAAILHKIGTFKVSRGEGDTSAIDNAIEIVKTNRILGIFPEGTRSKDGKLKRAKSGTVLVASMSKGDVIPAGITYKKGKFLRKLVIINFGCIIKNETLKITDNNRHELKIASEYIMSNIAQLVEYLNPEDGKKDD